MSGALGNRFRKRDARTRKGAMLVLVAVTLVILFVAAAFSVDIAYMFLANEQLHVATDAAAKAAVVTLSQGSNTAAATTTAINYAAANRVCGSPCTITSGNVSFGKVTYTSSGSWAFAVGGTPTTAAKVSGTMSVPLFFAPVLGTNTYTPNKNSTAAFVRNKWCFVFDRSGSMCFDMSGRDWYFPSPVGYKNGYPKSPYYPHATLSRLGNLTIGANTFLTTLTNSPGGTGQNMVGMCTFGDSASTDCAFTTTYSTITTKLSYYITKDIYKTGVYNASTNLHSGLQEALELFTSSDDGTVWNKIIVVFSDGQWNEGSDPLGLVSQAVNAGITIHTIGMMAGANTTMQQLAAQTGGQYLTVSDAAALQAAFKKLAESIPVLLTQ